MKAQHASSMLTLVIGWFGSAEGQLAKYAALPQDGGHRLYGNRDPITPAADVENFVSTLRARSVPVRTVRFDTEVHLGGYRSDPDTYRRAVDALRGDVMRRDSYAALEEVDRRE